MIPTMLWRHNNHTGSPNNNSNNNYHNVYNNDNLVNNNDYLSGIKIHLFVTTTFFSAFHYNFQWFFWKASHANVTHFLLLTATQKLKNEKEREFFTDKA